MKNPMPAPIAPLSELGTASMTASRTRVKVSKIKTTPEMKTAPNAVSQGTPMAPTTVKAK